MVKAPLNPPRLVFLCPAVALRRSSIVRSCSAWRPGHRRMATHNELRHSFSTHKSKLTQNHFSWLTDPHVFFCGVGVGVTHHSYHNGTSGKPNGACVFTQNSTPTFEMSRSSQPRKWEVRPYGRFFAAARVDVLLSDCRLSLCSFFSAVSKKKCWILDILCHDLRSRRYPVGWSWRTDNSTRKLQCAFTIPGNKAKCSNYAESAQPMHCNNWSPTSAPSCAAVK